MPTPPSSLAPAPHGTPQVLRRPLGFPVGPGAPGPVAVVVGGRGEAVALAEVVRRLGAAGLLVRAGDADDALPPAVRDQLGFGRGGGEALALEAGGSRGQRLGAAVAALDEAFTRHRPSAVVVHGGSPAALAGALAADAVGVPVVHVGAGLRSFDRAVPGERHRVLIDQLAELCCAPTALAVRNLRAEGVADERILLTGGTSVESVHHLRLAPDAQADVLAGLGLTPGFVLLTLHRGEDVDPPAVLRQVLTEMGAVAADGAPVVLVAPPRDVRRWRADGLGDLLDRFAVLAPQPPAQFLALLEQARLVVTDSGGVQEEAAVLGRRVILLRRRTERPELLGASGALVPAGLRLAAAVRSALARGTARGTAREPVPLTPYGDGSASRVVVESIVKLVAPS
ncbi:UDP-N-acetyl glucosamine 2-epimerase [Kineococcus sp. SYSU DK001]|uniref:UDP-N-acetyl glucosamine 2-epimerase n=1 Tax=Kineococcus sp. SYSU DK001 TaxID=3383122 RepID=UPI003D7ED815